MLPRAIAIRRHARLPLPGAARVHRAHQSARSHALPDTGRVPKDHVSRRDSNAARRLGHEPPTRRLHRRCGSVTCAGAPAAARDNWSRIPGTKCRSTSGALRVCGRNGERPSDDSDRERVLDACNGFVTTSVDRSAGADVPRTRRSNQGVHGASARVSSQPCRRHLPSVALATIAIRRRPRHRAPSRRGSAGASSPAGAAPTTRSRSRSSSRRTSGDWRG